MNAHQLKRLLEKVKQGNLSVGDAVNQLRYLPIDDLGHTQIDTHRELRRGFPEVIYCQNKTQEQIEHIIDRMIEQKSDILATRCPEEIAAAIQNKYPKTQYYPLSKALVIQPKKRKPKGGMILVISAGTSDIPIAEEAAVTAQVMGNQVETIYDIGVAGIHRLLQKSPILHKASVIVAAAGMEGALPSVVSGLVGVPVIAVPTSIGYGASFGGISALLAMLNCCSAGVVVVNIDNGFGAGYAASLINQSGRSRKSLTPKGE